MIGLALGFAVRVVFAAVEFAGEIVGLQMGLNFAGFFDPVSASPGTATSRFFGTMVAWLFVVINGHLLVMAALVQSFNAFPVGPEPFAFLRQTLPHRWGAEIFRTGLWIALPLVAMLLFVNLVLGMISRVASQINIFAIGFPITLGRRPDRHAADAADAASAVHDGAGAPAVGRSADIRAGQRRYNRRHTLRCTAATQGDPRRR